MLESLRYYHKGARRLLRKSITWERGKQDGFKEIEYSLTLSFHWEKNEREKEFDILDAEFDAAQ